MDLGAQTSQIDEIYHALSYRVSTAANILAQSEFLHEVPSGGGTDVLGWSAGVRKITMVLFMVELNLEKKTAVFGSLFHLLIQGGLLPVINGVK